MRKIVAILIVAAIGAAGWYGLNSTKEKPVAKSVEAKPVREPNVLHFAADAPQLAYLKIEPVVASQVPLLEALQGRVAYNEDATSRITAPINGRVTKIHAQLGDHVKAGQSLLTLDAPDYAQANAEAHRAVADLRLKKAAFERAKMLFEGEVLARKDMEAVSGDLEQSSIEVERTRARLNNLGTVGNEGFVLRSRVGGVVTERQVNPGSEVRSDAPGALFVVSDPAHLWVNVEVPEKDLGKIHVGQSLRVESEAYSGESFTAKVLLIGKVLDPATRRVTVRCSVDNREEKLKPEMFVRATLLGGETSLPHVPNTALVTEGVQNYLFVERTPGVLEKRRVNLFYRGHEESYIDSGLSVGERVVAAGALLLNAELAGN